MAYVAWTGEAIDGQPPADWHQDGVDGRWWPPAWSSARLEAEQHINSGNLPPAPPTAVTPPTQPAVTQEPAAAPPPAPAPGPTQLASGMAAQQQVARLLGAGYVVQQQYVDHTTGAPVTTMMKSSSPNHVLHLILTLFTAGLWMIVWFFVAARNGSRQTVQVSETAGQATVVRVG